MMNRTLVFFTASFPYGKGETFIESEILFLSKKFAKVIILTNGHGDKTRPIPSNVLVRHIPYNLSLKDKLYSFSGLLSSIFWRELFLIKKHYNLKITKRIISTALFSLFKAKKISLLLDSILKENNSDVLQTVFYAYWSNDMAVGLAYYRSKKSNVRCVCRAHRWDLYFDQSSIGYLPFRKFLYDNMSQIFFISEHGIKYFIETHNVDQRKLKLATLGTTNLTGRTQSQGQSSQIIISCSSLTEVKRVGLIIESLSLVSLGQPISWIHFGTGHLLDQMKELANNLLGDRKNISFDFFGFIPNKELVEYYQKHHVDLFINLSSSEGLPVSIMEAMSAGIPIIATNVGGVGEIVEHDMNGLLLNSDPSPDQVVKALEKLLGLGFELKEQMRERAYQTWNDKYNASKNYESFTEDLLAL
ncbi:MAG: glycosyltransferase [Bacteroidota bacterium]